MSDYVALVEIVARRRVITAADMEGTITSAYARETIHT